MDHDPEYDSIEREPIEREPRRLGRRARWAVPAVALLATGGVIAGTTMAGAQAAPSLPARSAATLLADLQRTTGPGPMSATVQETANLGLPALPGSGETGSGLSLLSGTHTFQLWYADSAHVRVAQQVQLGETDTRVNGRQIWLWNSKTQTATHVVLPQHRQRFFRDGSSRPGQGTGAYQSHLRWDGPAPTPQQAARRFLALVGPTTTVAVQRNVSVAGQDAYQISLAPKDSRSLFGQIRIAIDARRFYPLRVQVFARGSDSPAFQVGYTSITLGRPAAANFTFTPPPGAKVKTVSPAASPAGAPGWRGYMPGQRGWRGWPPKPGPHGSLFAKPSPPPDPGGPASLGNRPFNGLLRPSVMGKGWLSVLVLRPGRPSSGQMDLSTWTSGNTVHAAFDPATQISSGNNPGAAILRALLRAATPVHGSWGSGRLLHTSLVNVLIDRDGSILIGAVTPSVLYADAAAIK